MNKIHPLFLVLLNEFLAAFLNANIPQPEESFRGFGCATRRQYRLAKKRE